MGLKRRKVGQIPAKANVEKQAEFLKNELEPSTTFNKSVPIFY